MSNFMNGYYRPERSFAKVNNKQRMLAVLDGQTVDKIPYVPRLDLWYRANQLAGTLGRKYKAL